MLFAADIRHRFTPFKSEIIHEKRLILNNQSAVERIAGLNAGVFSENDIEV